MIKMMIADDNEAIRGILTAFASEAGYKTIEASDGDEALEKFRVEKPDVVLLDVMMPRLDGFSICREIRRESNVPILMITARGEDYDRIMVLDIGADDYIVKPFSAAEVMARVRAIMRRLERPAAAEDTKSKTLTRGSLVLDYDECRASISGKVVNLTKREFDILTLLAENRGRVFSRDHLLESLWGYDYEGDTRTVDTHIKRLRAKTNAVPHPDWQIKTSWGVGYSFEVTS